MQYPPKRDRLVTYIASWTDSLKPEDRIHLDPPLVVKHDCITKEAWVSGSVRITKDIDLTAQIIAPFKMELDCLGLEIGHPHWIVPSSFVCDITQKDIREQVIRTNLRFNAEFDVVVFINQVAAALHHPPLLTLEKHTIRREVLVKFMSNKRHWMDEAYWLAVSAALPQSNLIAQECALMRALLKMRREGDGTRLTLRPTLDAEAARGLIKARGIQFALSDEDCNKLLAIGRPGYHPQRLTITLGFCRIVPGASQVSNALVPHIHDVGFVSAEASHA